jgi:hypothetical protein
MLLFSFLFIKISSRLLIVITPFTLSYNNQTHLTQCSKVELRKVERLVRLIVVNKNQVISIKTKLFRSFDKPVYKLFTYGRSS